MIDKDYLQKICAEYGIVLNAAQLDAFDRYAELLVETNKVMNLTAITDPQGIVEKHFLDSLLLLRAAPQAAEGKLIDVGTGAGFPGIPMAIASADCRLTLLDSLGKRVRFLENVSQTLGLDAAAIHARAEDGGKEKSLREQFDTATARAVARLRELAEYCLPFVKVGGVFAALKGGEIEEELAEAQNAIRLMGGRFLRSESFTLPDGSRRSIVLIEKIAPTPPQYPRPGAKMAKKPL